MNQITTGTLEEAYKRISKVCKDLNIDLNEFLEWYKNKNRRKNIMEELRAKAIWAIGHSQPILYIDTKNHKIYKQLYLDDFP